MNKKHSFVYSIVILFLLFSFSSCKYQEGTFEVKADDVFKLELPNYVSSTQQLAPGSPIQFLNRYRTIYVVGLYDSKGKSRTLASYDSTVIKRFSLDLKEFKSQKIREQRNDGLQQNFYRLEGKSTGENIVYFLMTAEDNEYYYQVCTWTLDFRLEKYEQDLKSIIASFERT